MMPTLMILGGGDDPIKDAESLLTAGQWQRIDGGWLVVEDDRRRVQNRERQRRHRASKRRDSNAPDERDSNASDDLTFDSSGGEDHSLPTPFGGREGVSDTPGRNASNARDRDARNGDARHAWDTGPALSPEERAANREAIEAIKRKRFE